MYSDLIFIQIVFGVIVSVVSLLAGAGLVVWVWYHALVARIDYRRLKSVRGGAKSLILK